jgi:hypothetical protein
VNLRSSIRVLASLLFFVGFSYLSSNNASGQTCPANGSANIQSAGWQKGTTVSVFIEPGLTGDARRAAEQAFTNWNAASGTNNSAVTYSFTTTRPTSGVGNYLIVGYGTNLTDAATGNQVRAQATYNSDPTSGHTTRGGIRIDESMTNFDAVLETMVHEIGHPAGLGHCTGSGCTPSSSVMTLVVVNPPTAANFNRSYGRSTVPTACDNQTLMVSNYPPCSPPVTDTCTSWDANLCTCNDPLGGGLIGGGDSGGGGYYYYPCTPYYWVYYESWDYGETWAMVDYSYAGCW